ncbi:MAG: hypothetical protein WC412_06990 [Candidatus Omnitrophota bacterium]|jgi:hypothetical protein
MKKCPFLMLGMAPKSSVSKLVGSEENVLIVGNCMERDCALWGMVTEGSQIIEEMCSIRRIAQATK